MRIWKWRLEVTDLQQVVMPRGARVLHVDTQAGAPQVWALVDETLPLEPRAFATYGTGHVLPDVRHLGVYVGTYITDALLVFHVFDLDVATRDEP